MWNNFPNILKYFFFLFFGAFASACFNGIIGNRADAIFLQLFPLLQEKVFITGWQIVLFVLIFLLVVCVPLVWSLLHYYSSQQAAIDLVKLDDSLLRLLASFKQNPDRQAATKLLFQEFLEDTLELFKDGCRISILRPSENNVESLIIWQSLRVPPETIQRTEFYLGSNPDNKRIGIAGFVFKQKMLKIVHLSWDKKQNKWIADDQNYYPFVSRDSQKSMPYHAIVAVPILDNTDSNKCLGVLCLDSKDKEAFDSQKVQDGLRSLSERISAILLILDNLS